MPKNPSPPRLTPRFWLLAGMWLMIAVSSAYAAKTVRSYLLTDARFALRAPQPGPLRNEGVAISGSQYASQAAVLHVFASDYGRSIFGVDIKERRRRLLAVD